MVSEERPLYTAGAGDERADEGRAPVGTDGAGKRCLLCGETKPLTEFPRQGAQGRSARCLVCHRATRRKPTAEERSRYNATLAPEEARLKAEAFTAYGGRCVCCGESVPQFLRVEHAAPGGAVVRNRLTLWRMLLEEGWPADYELVCGNCSLGKVMFGVCPHQAQKVQEAQEMDGGQKGQGSASTDVRDDAATRAASFARHYAALLAQEEPGTPGWQFVFGQLSAASMMAGALAARGVPVEEVAPAERREP